MTVDPSDLRARDANIAAWRALSSATGCEILEQDGLFTYFSGAPTPNFTPTIVTAPPGDPERALADREHAYGERGIPFGFEIPVGLDAATEQAAAGLGLTLLREQPVMVMNPIADIPDDGVQIRTVSELNYDEFIDTQAEGFGDSRELVRIFAPPSTLAVCRCFTVYSDGVPAAAGLTIVTGDEAGIFGISTKEALRRRGLGRAVTAAAVRAARAEGASFAWLHSSELGRPVYERLGFRVVGSVRIYTRPAEG